MSNGAIQRAREKYHTSRSVGVVCQAERVQRECVELSSVECLEAKAPTGAALTSFCQPRTFGVQT